jgi:hypothetical protein
MSHFLENFLHNVNKTIDNVISIKNNPSIINQLEDITEELYLLSIKENPKIISNGLLDKFNNEQFYIKIIKEDYTNLFYIQNQTFNICLEAIKQNYIAIRYIRDQNVKICKEAIKISACAYFYIRESNHDIDLAVVRKAGYMLKHIRKQTPSICYEAVKQDGLSLEYVDDKFNLYDMYKAAILQNPYALQFVRYQTKDLCELAISLEPECIIFVRLQTKYQLSKFNNSINLECSICMNSDDINEYSKTTCNHIFHTKCIEKWLDIKSDCPYCRNKICIEYIN